MYFTTIKNVKTNKQKDTILEFFLGIAESIHFAEVFPHLQHSHWCELFGAECGGSGDWTCAHFCCTCKAFPYCEIPHV